MASVAKHIKRLRLEKGLTQEALAERLHVTRQAVSNWERNAAQPDLGGRLVSGCYEERSNGSLSSFRVEAADGLSLTTAAEGRSWAGELSGIQPLEGDGNAFSCYLFPAQAEPEPSSGTATLTVEGLVDFRTWRNWRFWG